jgi:hypothetical protein
MKQGMSGEEALAKLNITPKKPSNDEDQNGDDDDENYDDDDDSDLDEDKLT